MKTNYTICSALAFLLLCSYAVCSGGVEGVSPSNRGQDARDTAIGIVLEILRSNDQEMQAAAIAMVKEMPGTQVTEALAKEHGVVDEKGPLILLKRLGTPTECAFEAVTMCNPFSTYRTGTTRLVTGGIEVGQWNANITN